MIFILTIHSGIIKMSIMVNSGSVMKNIKKFKINLNIGRYQNLIISITVFLVLIASLLIFTFFASSRLEKNTALVNEVNNISKSSQTVMKDLYALQLSYGSNIRTPHVQRLLKELEHGNKFVSSSFKHLKHVGKSKHNLSYNYVLPKITDKKLLANLQAGSDEWKKLSPKITAYLEHAQDISYDSEDNLGLAIEQAKASSAVLNGSLNELTDNVVKLTRSESRTIRIVQLLGVITALLYFIFFMFFVIRRLENADKELVEARRETEEIMETVNTGLFLLDRDLTIGKQYSDALVDIIGTDKLAGENFANVLRNRISDKDLETTRQFITQLYNPRVKSKLVNDLNPLNKIMLHNDSGSGSGTERYLDFAFSRVYEDKTISRILVNVSDVTEAVLLEHRLEKEREQNDLQIEMLTTILNVSPKIINDFISSTNMRIDTINGILKSVGSSQFELENKLKLLYREVHSLKGEASSLQLHSFTTIATEAEEHLEKLQNQGRLSGNDFLPLTVYLDELINLSNTIEVLGHRINQASASSSNTQPQSLEAITSDVAEKISPKIYNKDASEEINYYEDFVQEIAKRQHKEVILITQGLDITLPKEQELIVKEIIVQLIRNSIVHGIEESEIRVEHNKPATGKLKLKQSVENGSFALSIEDDGAGLDYTAIRNKLVEIGRYDRATAETLTKGQLVNVLFSSRFSTKEEADEDGGRGVGLDVIKDRVKKLKGKIKVNSEAGRFTRFVIVFPLNS